MAMSDTCELVLDAHAELGEGPIWDASTKTLLWVDLLRGQVHRFDPATRVDDCLELGQPVGAAAVRAAGGLVLALRDGFAVKADGQLQWIADTERDKPQNRMNDGKCDPAGRFWAGTMALDSMPGAGSLYRLDPDHTVTRVLDGVTISNGLGWSPSNDTMYFIDTGQQGVDAFDYDHATGNVRNRRRLVDIPKDSGVPDGMAVDADGYLWVALCFGWAVHRYAPDGSLDQIVELPVSLVTSCAFGGPDLTDLYITSGRLGLSDEALREQPQAGALFRYRPGVAGLPPAQYQEA